MHYTYEIWVWWIFWIFLLVWIFATLGIFQVKRRNRETPIELLKKRFTRGEITKKEFVEMKKRIEIN